MAKRKLELTIEKEREALQERERQASDREEQARLKEEEENQPYDEIVTKEAESDKDEPEQEAESEQPQAEDAQEADEASDSGESKKPDISEGERNKLAVRERKKEDDFKALKQQLAQQQAMIQQLMAQPQQAQPEQAQPQQQPAQQNEQVEIPDPVFEPAEYAKWLAEENRRVISEEIGQYTTRQQQWQQFNNEYQAWEQKRGDAGVEDAVNYLTEVVKQVNPNADSSVIKQAELALVHNARQVAQQYGLDENETIRNAFLTEAGKYGYTAPAYEAEQQVEQGGKPGLTDKQKAQLRNRASSFEGASVKAPARQSSYTRESLAKMSPRDLSKIDPSIRNQLLYAKN